MADGDLRHGHRADRQTDRAMDASRRARAVPRRSMSS